MKVTLGEDRVRVSFNPSSNDLVSQIKQKTAELINLCDEHMLHRSSKASGESDRCFTLAQDAYETAAMYAVKGATSGQ